MTSPTGVVTRFAPSPTGFLHIGGARTALFSWLYAKHTGGKFLLRIEDTDRARSTEAAIAAIIEGMKWLELDWDGEPVYQFARAKRHAEVAQQMLEAGKAYRCYAAPEELAAMRERAMKEGRAPGYDGTWRDKEPKDWPKDKPYAVRLKAPREGETSVADHVQGHVTWANKDLDDMVLLRSDGTPTYMLAVVVDDHDMGITHIIRGDDHLTNAARQTQIYRCDGLARSALRAYSADPRAGWRQALQAAWRAGRRGLPRHGLPAARRCAIISPRLGWSHGDDEIFSTEQAIEWFDLDAIGRSPSRFDFAKLENLNGNYIRNTPDADLVKQIEAIAPEIEAAMEFSGSIGKTGWTKLKKAMPGLKERAKTLVELLVSARYLFVKRPLDIDAKAAKLLEGAAPAHLAALHARFSELEDWKPAALEAVTRAYAQEAAPSSAMWPSLCAPRLLAAPPRRPSSRSCMCSAGAKASRASRIRRVSAKLPLGKPCEGSRAA